MGEVHHIPLTNFAENSVIQIGKSLHQLKSVPYEELIKMTLESEVTGRPLPAWHVLIELARTFAELGDELWSYEQAQRFYELADVLIMPKMAADFGVQNDDAPWIVAETAIQTLRPYLRKVAAMPKQPVDLEATAEMIWPAWHQMTDDERKERLFTLKCAAYRWEAAYRSKAMEAHPDKPSGSTEAMQELNEARRRLLA